MKRIAVMAFVAVTLFLSGCATIVGKDTHNMSISSQPSGASIMITDETGRTVYSGSTPTTVSLDKSDGSYWGGKSYEITISQDGYQARTVQVNSSPNGWYLAGNIVFGGLIGWFIVDPFSGKMYNLKPDAVDVNLADSVAGERITRDQLVVMLIEDVPAELLAHLEPIEAH